MKRAGNQHFDKKIFSWLLLPPCPQSRGNCRAEHPLSLYIKCQVLFISSPLPTRYQHLAYCKGNIPWNGSTFQRYGAAGTILGLWWDYSTSSCFIKCHGFCQGNPEEQNNTGLQFWISPGSESIAIICKWSRQWIKIIKSKPRIFWDKLHCPDPEESLLT